jgi:CitB family two-component system sensor histidine kinase MalK
MAGGIPLLRLRTRITLFVCAILGVVLGITGTMVTSEMERRARAAVAERALLVARMVAEADVVVRGLKGALESEAIPAYAERMRGVGQVDFVVVLDAKHDRLSHPNPSLIGTRFKGGDDQAVDQGRTYTSVATGSLGTSLRAFTPVVDPESGRQIGAVAVGILMTGVRNAVNSVRRQAALGIVIGFSVGILGALLLAHRLKGALLGMEPVEIATTFQQRNALLHSVREGVVAADRDMRVTLVNEEAARLFGLAGVHGDLIGKQLEGVFAGAEVKSVLLQGKPALDQESVINGLHVVTSTVPVMVDGRITGVVATFRDKTELRHLAEQLTGVRLYADALRAQTHEFMNRLHVILGLVWLKKYEDLGTYITDITGQLRAEGDFVIQRIKDPVVAGFLLARFSAAREQNIAMYLSDDSWLGPCNDETLAHDLVTIVGNLLENAVEAMGAAETRKIFVQLRHDEGRLEIVIEDSGPGIAPELLGRIFDKGFSTKGERRGYGLWQAERAARSHHGTLSAARSASGGTAFTAVLQVPDEEVSV